MTPHDKSVQEENIEWLLTASQAAGLSRFCRGILKIHCSLCNLYGTRSYVCNVPVVWLRRLLLWGYHFNGIPLKTKGRLFYLKPSPYRAVNTFHICYKNQSFYNVSGRSRCLFSDKYKTRKYSVDRAYSC
jgi:hypothetical protein